MLDEVHSLIESHKDTLRFLMTGSSARKLKREGANLLAGRAITLHLHPFTSQEIDIVINRAVQFGTLPAIYLEEENPTPQLNAYVDTYLKEEIIRSNDYLEKDYKFFYWQNQNDLEVDLILSRGPSDIPIAIEIKSQQNPDTKELKALLTFKKDHPNAKLFCLCQATHEYELEGIKVLPWRNGLIDILTE